MLEESGERGAEFWQEMSVNTRVNTITREMVIFFMIITIESGFFKTYGFRDREIG